MKRIAFALPIVLALAFSEACWGICVVRVDALSKAPTPPNPVMVLGRVTSTSPVTLSDGSGTVTVNGLTASLGDFLVVTGNWDGSSLTVSGPTQGFMGPAMTQMIWIPAGSFLMGNTGIGDDLYRDQEYDLYWEKPQHSVSLSGYWIGKYAVTRGEYRAFRNAGGYSDSSYWSTAGWSWKGSLSRTEPSYWAANQDWAYESSGYHQPFLQTDNHPVVGVSYYEAEAFCNWAGGHLPTEAQWEKAARWDGHPRIYPWGDTWDPEKCNNWSDTLYPGYQTSPVGSYPSGASPYGCQDMAGNVHEWCQDWYKSYPGSSLFDWTGFYRVLRGGDWYTFDGNSYGVSLGRCASRHGSDGPGIYLFVIGFRLAR
ncbi:MAG: formylglycine-generating enzyme family protein [Armatimonadota bacterium]|nr:formylglycine-generating enzyme family protein [Armatimonadota bacterium]